MSTLSRENRGVNATARDRLSAMVRLVEEARADEAKAKDLDRHWHRYIKGFAADAADLAGDIEAAALLVRLREGGSGWPTRAASLGGVIKTASSKASKRTDAADLLPMEPSVLALLEVGGADDLPRATLRNIRLVLEHDSRWQGRIRRNQFAEVVEIDGEPLADEETSRCACWLDEHYRIDAPTSRVDEALRLVAVDHGYHPVRDYLDGLRWDGRERVAGLLSGYMGAVAGSLDVEILHRRLSAAFLVSAVARIMEPGCKVDTMIVLQGAQGAGKSTAIRVLAGKEWFCDTALDTGSKDAYAQVAGVWLYEIGEMESWNKREQGVNKRFISSQRDRFRPSYGRNLVTQERQVVFVGTTNADRFLADSTGSRRYWPVTVGTPDIDGLSDDRDQLWAEAVHLYREGTPWHLSKEDAATLADASEAYAELDPWQARIEDWLGRHGAVAFELSDMIEQAVGVMPKDQHGGTAKRVGAILRGLGYTSERVRRSSGRCVLWSRDG